MRRQALLAFSGRFRPESFLAFMDARARLLDLVLRPRRSGPDRVEVIVDGEDALIGMFEMACSLGPIDCLVLDVAELAEASVPPPATREEEGA
ncbi:hypothetical protein ACFQWF_16145 [Methylorubrum suomiense]|uniref:Acylphosphatase n=2 Tax=Methylorubrum suomiense TaxID=144191 RepID=A0ABQ4V3H1_9HYPH|nr:hypothetical protein BGCPKDLD_4414 [Methylorubrum suomiense]